MPRLDRLVVVLGLVLVAGPAPLAQAPEAPAALVSMRGALGGAALDAVKNFAVTGASTQQIINGDQSQALELYCEFPDKFVRRTEFRVPGPVDIETIIREGFNGGLPISETLQHSMLDMPQPPRPATRESPDAALARIMNARHAAFARTIVPMIGAAPAAAPLTFEAAAPTTVDGRAADVVTARDGATEVFQLLIDQTSHLPLKVIWKAPPMLMVSSVSSVTVAVRNGTATTMRGAPPVNIPPSVPSGHAPPGTVMLDGFPADPNAYVAGLPPVQHELVFSQFETVDGVTWPRRWKEYADGKILEDTRLGKFKINTKIDPRKFEIAK